MWGPSIIGMFCEDIREEASGQQTLVGLIPDTMVLPALPFVLPKISIYIRVHLDSKGPRPSSLAAYMEHSDGERFTLPSWNSETITKAFDEAASTGVPIAGLILKATLRSFRIEKSGVMVVKVVFDNDEYIAANLRVLNDQSNASARHDKISQPAP